MIINNYYFQNYLHILKLFYIIILSFIKPSDMVQVIEIPNGYHEVLLTAIILSMECILIGFCISGRARRQLFSKDYMKENFEDEHQEAFKQEITEGGYPDVGSGYYAKKLSYKDWYFFNNAQRAHMNFVEMIASSLMFLLVGGLYCSCLATGFGALMIVSRAIYAWGYMSSGPQGRRLGAILNGLAILGLFILSMIYCVNAVKGNCSFFGAAPTNAEM